jgi:HAD superfamily hydrolase (TIGR01509 family)
MERFKAVCFDLFDTLISFDITKYRNDHREAAQRLGIKVEDFLLAWHQSEHPARSGIFDCIGARCESVLTQLGSCTPSATETLSYLEKEAILHSVTLLPGIRELLEHLNEIGKKLALISNASSAGLIIVDQLNLRHLFQELVFSFSEKMWKPNPQIYLLACDRLKVDPDHCAFVSDGDGGELSGALRAGLYPYRFDPLNLYPDQPLPPGTIDCKSVEDLYQRLIS